MLPLDQVLIAQPFYLNFDITRVEVSVLFSKLVALLRHWMIEVLCVSWILFFRFLWVSFLLCFVSHNLRGFWIIFRFMIWLLCSKSYSFYSHLIICVTTFYVYLNQNSFKVTLLLLSKYASSALLRLKVSVLCNKV